ncbi:MAG: UbiA prenyltransferase family protein [Candidatus Azobacteroides sp.]|nr:UbiA prenyltransferase family protein [Candidatus Azobacteroides sp.]
MKNKIVVLFNLLRVNQWVKNILVFLPLFFGMQWHRLPDVLIAFIGFSFIASSVYIFNDLFDVEEDRLHPQKKNRPIPAGLITYGKAVILMGLCFLSGLLMFFFSYNPFCLVLIAFYVVMNVLYTIKLKHVAIVDIVIISLGFVIRMIIGGLATEVQLSHWIILMTFLLALFLAVAKRRDDVVVFMETGKISRKNIAGYNLEFVNGSMSFMSGVLIVSYIMYTLSPEVIGRYGNHVYLTSFFVIIGIMRYFQITFVMKKSGDPTSILWKDIFLQITILAWAGSFIFLMLYKNV